MSLLLIALAGLALAGAGLLRLPHRGGLMGPALAFLAGLMVMALLIRVATGALGIGRATDFDAVVNHAVEVSAEEAAPIIVFSGASFSRNAISEQRLTGLLREKGYPHRVVNLSLEAASLAERDRHLEDFMAATPRAPDIVFVEIGQVTDERPAFIFENSKFSMRAIDQFDLTGTRWAVQGMLEGACAGTTACVRDLVLTGMHAGLNVLNVGLVSQGKTLATIAPKESYEGNDTPREEIDPAWRAEELAATVEAASVKPWARAFRDAQRARLMSEGVREVAYYFPPVIEAGTRAYAGGLCNDELAAFTCIAPLDPALLASLDGNEWLDRDHLLDSGAEVYEVWLAEQLIASGILEGGK
ncbi:MAG: hypothetical protein R3C13_06790 [Hyphomonas sp.]|uniref:hypothetical protein n=1 Tax=Hyphomonas sp. TaxID=87 RepID=UPI00352957E5